MNADHYAIVVVPLASEDGGGFVVHVPDLPGCMSDGETQEEAIINARDAIACWLDTANETGREVPLPGSSVTKLREMEMAVLSALKDALHYIEHADGKIADLEAKVENLISLISESRGHSFLAEGSIVAARNAQEAVCH